MVYALNASAYTLLTFFTLCLVLSAFVGPLGMMGACCIMCTQCVHLAALIIAGVFRFGGDGAICADVTKDATEGTTYKDIGDMMASMFIAQAVLYCFYSCCLGIVTQFTVMVYMAKKAMAGM